MTWCAHCGDHFRPVMINALEATPPVQSCAYNLGEHKSCNQAVTGDMTSIHQSYDASQSYRWNYEHAPAPSRSAELPEDRDAPIVTVCNIGKFSKHATLYLKSKGYRNVRSAKGGLNEWVRKGYDTT